MFGFRLCRSHAGHDPAKRLHSHLVTGRCPIQYRITVGGASVPPRCLWDPCLDASRMQRRSDTSSSFVANLSYPIELHLYAIAGTDRYRRIRSLRGEARLVL